MRKTAFIISFIIYLPLIAGDMETEIRKLAMKGIDLATNLKYSEADSVFKKIVSMEPDNPRGHFLRSAIYFWMFSEDTKNETIGNTFRDLSYKAVEVAEAKLEINDNDVDAMFFLGGAYGSLGRYYAMTQSYLNAYWYGKKGVGYLEDVIEADSAYYDAYLGLGIYHYLADVLPRFVKILSFVLGVDGDRKQGIAELELASKNGYYTKTEAMFFLGALYTYRENEFEKAIVIFNELLKKYPNNPGALISLGRCYANMGECDLAIQAFNQILKNKEGQSRLPRGSIFYQLGEVYYKQNDFKNAASNYLLAVANDTARVGKRRWIYPRSQFNAAECFEILGDTARARYYLAQINKEDSEHLYERAQAKLAGDTLTHLDIEMIMAENERECGQYVASLARLANIEKSYKYLNNPENRRKLTEIAYRRAEIFYEQKKYELAIKEFSKLIALEEKEEWIAHWSYFYIGSSYKALGQYKKAEEAFEEAEDTDSDRLLERIERERLGLPE